MRERMGWKWPQHFKVKCRDIIRLHLAILLQRAHNDLNEWAEETICSWSKEICWGLEGSRWGWCKWVVSDSVMKGPNPQALDLLDSLFHCQTASTEANLDPGDSSSLLSTTGHIDWSQAVGKWIKLDQSGGFSKAFQPELGKETPSHIKI